MHPHFENHTRHESGFYFHNNTPAPVASLLASLNQSRQRVRLFLGDIETGVAWNEEYDIIGTIGASTGPCRSALLIKTARSMGGCAILTHCVVGIQSGPSSWVYRHPHLSLGNWTTGPVHDSGYTSAAYCDGTLHAQFRKEGGADRYCAFMRGERWSK